MGDLIPLIKEDGTPFTDEEISSISQGLDALDDDARVDARNQNAQDIAEHGATRMLVRVRAPARAPSSRSD